MNRLARHLCLPLLVLTTALCSAAERQPDQQHEQAIEQLQASSADIEQRLAALDSEIARTREQSRPEKDQRDRAEARYEEAKRALQSVPSVANRERVEANKFQFFIADNQYQRAARDLERLEEKRQALLDTLAANASEVARHQQGITRNAQLAAEREEQALQAAARKAARESQLRREKEQALRDSEQELTRARREQEAAMKEIASLKARLATNSAARQPSTAPVTTPVTVTVPVTAPPATRSTAPARPAPPPSRRQAAPATAGSSGSAAAVATLVRNGKDTYLKLIHDARSAGRSSRQLDKIMQMKSMTDNRVSRETSHSLRHLGNNLYQGNSMLRAGATEFVIGGQRWTQQIPSSSDREPYVLMLDNRDNKQPKLLLFAQSDLKR